MEFQRRKQIQGELVSEFQTGFWSLAADCNTDGWEDYYLAIQLAAGCSDKDTQAKMLQKTDPKLDEMIEIMEADELAHDDQTIIHTHESSASVHKVKSYQKQQYGSTTAKGNFHQQKGARGPSKNFCTGCGQSGHCCRDPMCWPLTKSAITAMGSTISPKIARAKRCTQEPARTQADIKSSISEREKLVKCESWKQ